MYAWRGRKDVIVRLHSPRTAVQAHPCGQVVVLSAPFLMYMLRSRLQVKMDSLQIYVTIRFEENVQAVDVHCCSARSCIA